MASFLLQETVTTKAAHLPHLLIKRTPESLSGLQGARSLPLAGRISTLDKILGKIGVSSKHD